MSAPSSSSDPSTVASGSSTVPVSSSDTQPPSSSPSDGHNANPESENQAPHHKWGCLYMIERQRSEASGSSFPVLVPVLDMISLKTSYVIGRGESEPGPDYVLQRKHLASSLYKSCSKLHFEIYMHKNANSGHHVFIKDLSTNGTILNGTLIGKGNINVLNHTDEIALVKKDYKVFQFFDPLNTDESENIPDVVKAKYVVLKEIGRGASGSVKNAYKKVDGAKLAVKIIQKSLTDGGEMQEVNILKSLTHPCITKLYDFMETDESYYIFMEKVEAGNLLSNIQVGGAFEEVEAKGIFYQMCLAVKYLHDNNIAHRDLKLENILIASTDRSNCLIKISDFGLSKIQDSKTFMRTLCGTPAYCAPEILGSSGQGRYTNAVDCWSLGVILYICLSGVPPFSHEVENQRYKNKILQAQYSFPAKRWAHISEDAKDLVKRFLVAEPKERITLCETLNCSWLRDSQMRKNVQDLLYPDNSLPERPESAALGITDSSETIVSTPKPKRPRLSSITEGANASTPILGGPSKIAPMLKSGSAGASKNSSS